MMTKPIATHYYGANYRAATAHAFRLIRGNWRVRLESIRGNWRVVIIAYSK